MTRPTIEQIDSALNDIDFHGNTSAKYLEKHANNICFALRVLRQLMDDPTEEMRTAYFEAIASKDGEIWRAEYKAMRDQLLEQVEGK